MTKKQAVEIKDSELIKEQEARRDKEQAVAKSIEDILISEGYALQPYIAYSEFGMAPRVRLVEVKSETNGETNTETEVEGSGDTDNLTQSSQS